MKKILFSFFFLLLFLFSFNFVFAENTNTNSNNNSTDTQAIIKQLQEQIRIMQAQIEELKTQLVTVQVELKLNRTLRQGLTGDDVKQLQEFLKQFPDIYPEGLVTGYFGPLTETAVKKFQEKNNIESIGIVGPKTTAKLNELVTEGTGKSEVALPGLPTAPPTEKKVEKATPQLTATTTIVTQTATTSLGTLATSTPPLITNTPAGIISPAPVITPIPTPTSTISTTTTGTVATTATTTPPTPPSGTDTTPPIISSVGASGLTARSATITWSTDKPVQYYWMMEVIYGTTIPYSSGAGFNPASLTTTRHSGDLVSLKSNTTYHYKVSVRDAAGNTASSPDYTFTTLASNISAIQARNTTGSDEQITWTTVQPSNSKVFYGTAPGNYTYSSSDATTADCSGVWFVASHCINLTNLAYDTVYYYQVRSSNASGQDLSPENQFTSASAPDPVPNPASPCLGGNGRIPGLPNCLMPENLSGTAWNEVDNATGRVLNTAICNVAVCGRNGEWRNMKNANGVATPNGYPPNSTYIQTPFDYGQGGQYFTNGVWQVSGNGIIQPGSSQVSYKTPTPTSSNSTSNLASVLEALKSLNLILEQINQLLGR